MTAMVPAFPAAVWGVWMLLLILGLAAVAFMGGALWVLRDRLGVGECDCPSCDAVRRG